MPIDEMKPANDLIIDKESISRTEIQNRFGAKHDVIKNITPGKYLTILAVETDSIVNGIAYDTLENLLKSQFGVNAMQTVFGASIPESENGDEINRQYNVHVTGHLRIETATPFL